MFSRLLARQLACPTGVLGRWVLGPLWNRRNAALNDAAFDALTPAPADRVLDVGFGGGYLLERLAGVVTDGMLAGVDVSPAMVAIARRRYRRLVQAGRVDFRCAPAEALPFAVASFTKACTVNSAFYWDDPARALAELARVLVDGGRLVLCLTCPRSLRHKGFARHGLKLYEPRDLHALLTAAGFQELQTNQAADRHRQFFCLAATRRPRTDTE